MRWAPDHAAGPAGARGGHSWTGLVLLFVCAAFLAGCQATGGRDDAPAARLTVSATELEAAEAARTAGLERFWARAVARIEFPGANPGERIDEQVEGHVQVVRPDRVAVSLGKLGNDLVYLGSDGSRSFLFDLTNRDDRVAVVAPRGDFAVAGVAGPLALDPADLTRLLALAPAEFDEETVLELAGGDRAGAAVARRPVPGGEQRVYFDQETMLPVAVEIDRGVDEQGNRVVVTAELSEYEAVRVRGRDDVRPRAPMRAIVTVPSAGVELTLWLNSAQNRRIRDVAFDFDRLREVLRVHRTVEP